MVNLRAACKSFYFVALISGVSWAVILAWPELASAVGTMAKGLFWSVPFVLTTALATFNNTLRVLDRIEEVVKSELRDLSRSQQEYLKETIQSTEDLIASLMVNSLIVISAGIAYFIVGAILSLPLPRWLPIGGTAIQFGLGCLATWILVIQFRAIQPMVAFYKFFTVDRHLPPDETRNGQADEVEGPEESSTES